MIKKFMNGKAMTGLCAVFYTVWHQVSSENYREKLIDRVTHFSPRVSFHRQIVEKTHFYETAQN